MVPGMARPRSDTVQVATPERILEAAELAFADHGFARATLADIARRAGIRRPSLLYHFESKEKLYTAVVERTFDRLTALLAEGMDRPLPFQARLEVLARTFATFLMDHPWHARIVVRELMDGEGPGAIILRDRVAPLVDLVVTFLEREGRGLLRPDLPVRAAVLHISSDVLLQNAAGTLRGAMWGDVSPDRTWAVARILFLEV